MMHRTPGSRKGRRWLIIAIVVLLAASLGAVLAGRRLLAGRPPKPTANPVTIVRFAGTPEFAAMPDEKKAPYLLAMRDNLTTILAAAEAGQFSKEEQAAALRNAIRGRARMEVTAYHALPAGPARKAHLDKLIDEQEQLRQARQRAIQSGGPAAAPPVPGPAQMKQFVESLAPDERVRLASFTYELIKRRMERGLPPWPFSDSGQQPRQQG